MMDILNVSKERYATKKFDENKKITEEQINKLEDLLRLSPSSTNIQPWHFVVAESKEGKERIAKSASEFYAFNRDKILNASVVIIFASKIDLTEEYLLHVLEKEDADGRYSQPDFKEKTHAGRKYFATMHKLDYKDFQHWADKQVYLNVGNFLLGTAALGLDSVPMEGIDFKSLDQEFNLREKGYSSVIVVAVGHHKDTDYNKKLPKSRLAKEEIIERY